MNASAAVRLVLDFIGKPHAEFFPAAEQIQIIAGALRATITRISLCRP